MKVFTFYAMVVYIVLFLKLGCTELGSVTKMAKIENYNEAGIYHLISESTKYFLGWGEECQVKYTIFFYITCWWVGRRFPKKSNFNE